TASGRPRRARARSPLQRDPPADARPASGPGGDFEPAAERAEEVAGGKEPGASRRRVDVEPRAVVLDGEADDALLGPHPNERPRAGACMSRRVSQRLGAAEMDGRLDLRRLSLERARLDSRLDRGLRRGRTQGLREPAVEQERRVDRLGELAKALERLADVLPELVQERACGGRIAVHELTRELEVHGERHEVLLRAVVEVTLDAPALLVGHCGEPGARGAELLDLPAEIVERAG